MRRLVRSAVVIVVVVVMIATVGTAGLVVPVVGGPTVPRALAASDGQLPAGGVLRIAVPEAFGGKTVVGQLAVDRVTRAGFVTAFGCDAGVPAGPDGRVSRADLNFDGAVAPVWSNRLIVQADNDGDVCLYTSAAAALVVDVNGVTFDTGINSFPNRRVDTRDQAQPTVPAGGELRLSIPEARGARTVVGQIAVDHVSRSGFITAYGCDRGLPTGADGRIARADLNFNGVVAPVWSNRLIVQADDDGDICLYTSAAASLVVDINGVSDVGLASFPNRRLDTRATSIPTLPAGGVLRITVPEAVEAATVIGQIAVDGVRGRGFVTAFGCDGGPPLGADGGLGRADLNFDGNVAPVWSNRLIVQADENGDVCFYTSAAASLIIDINGVSDIGIQSFPNRRTDTRLPGASGTDGPVLVNGVPVWPPYVPLPALVGRAALTGLPADSAVTARPIVAVKIDNYGAARPQWGLDQADAVIEVNVEGVSRFVALYQTNLPVEVGPVRSARTEDVDLLAAMNRPVFAYSGANIGVNSWLAAASSSGLLVDYTAQRNPCYSRSPDRAGPHNLLLDVACAVGVAAPAAGPGRPLWDVDANWPGAITSSAVDGAPFIVPMDGVSVQWQWDPTTGTYLRSQDGQPHLTVSGRQISANSVVVLSTTYIPSPVDARSPNAVTTGSGTAVIHRDGQQIAATWTRPTAYDPFTFHVAGTNTLIPLDTGTTYLELVRAPTGTA